MPNQTISEANVNTNAVFFLTYSQLRQDLLTFGQPNFFNAANLPAGNSINGVTNFWVSSSVGAIFGLFTAQTDGFVGIGTGFTPGPQRVSAFLHEFGHAMGRVPEFIGGAASALDLWRFTNPGIRFFDGNFTTTTSAYFSLDGGVTKLANWGKTSDASDFLNDNLTGNDPFNEFVGNFGNLTNLDILITEALGVPEELGHGRVDAVGRYLDPDESLGSRLLRLGGEIVQLLPAHPTGPGNAERLDGAGIRHDLGEGLELALHKER